MELAGLILYSQITSNVNLVDKTNYKCYYKLG